MSVRIDLDADSSTLSRTGNGLPMPTKILVVDDNLDSRDLIHLHLTTEGYTVVTASNGQEGLYLASAEHPDLIITDINMPELDGLELIRQLRTQPEFETLPILVLTAFGRDQMDQAITTGANRALNKPAHFDALLDDVRELLAESERNLPNETP